MTPAMPGSDYHFPRIPAVTAGGDTADVGRRLGQQGRDGSGRDGDDGMMSPLQLR